MMRNIPRAVWIIIGIAFFVRLALFGSAVWFLGEESLLVSDAPRFYKIADALVAGHGFTLGEPPFEPSAFFPPLFLSFLAGSLWASGSFVPAVLVHVILGSLLPLVVWGIAGRFTEDRRVRTIAAALAAFEPQMILWSIVPTTEMLAGFTMAASLYFFLRLRESGASRDAIFSAVFLGFSTLTRPHGQFVFLIFVAILFCSVLLSWKRPEAGLWAMGAVRKRMLPVFLFAVSFFLILSPWLIRNYYYFGTVSVATTGLRNVYSDFAVSVITVATGTEFGDVRQELLGDIAERYGVSVKEVREDPRWGSVLAQEGFRIIREHPKEATVVLVVAGQAFFTQDLYTSYLGHFRVIPDRNLTFNPLVTIFTKGFGEFYRMAREHLGPYFAIPIVGRMFWLAVFFAWIGGAAVAVLRGGKERAAALVFVVLIGYYATTSMVGAFSDQGRLRYPVNSLMFILSSFSCVIGYDWIKRRRARVIKGLSV